MVVISCAVAGGGGRGVEQAALLERDERSSGICDWDGGCRWMDECLLLYMTGV